MTELNALEVIYIVVSCKGMVQIHLTQHGFGWTPGVGDGQGALACCDSWGRKESDTTE